MTKQLFADLLLITCFLAALLFLARGWILSSIASFFGGWVLALVGIVLWLILRRHAPEPVLEVDDTLL